MIIAIYGIPRSGKDFFISQLVKTDERFIHVKGSETLNLLAHQFFGQGFHQLEPNAQEKIRVEFVGYVRQLHAEGKNIVVDGHYAFPNDAAQFNVVFTQSDADLYDTFYYLNRSSATIKKHFLEGDKKKYSDVLTDERKVEEWENFEINGLNGVCESLGKDLIVLGENNNESIEFIIQNQKTQSALVDHMVDIIEAKGKQYKKILLTDLDKTMSINDLTDDFVLDAGLEKEAIKKIFKGDYYTPFQFFSFHQYLTSTPSYQRSLLFAAEKIRLNEALINDIEKGKSDTLVIGLTTGMAAAWEIINQSRPLFDLLFGYGTDTPDRHCLMTPVVKGFIAKKLREKGYSVWAVGDSFIDLKMLEFSHKGFLVNMVKLDKRITPLEKVLSKKNIFQLGYSNVFYQSIKEIPTIW